MADDVMAGIYANLLLRVVPPGLAGRMRAEILAVGSELLTPLRSDTNALWLTERLLEVGVEVGARVTVADDPALLESAFRDRARPRRSS